MAVKGIKNIKDSFGRLEKAGQIRVLRNGANAALNPPLKALRAAAPKGSEAHKTHKGNIVAPGFLSRKGIKKSVKVSRDKRRVFATIRLLPEAYYGSFKEHGWVPKTASGASGRAVAAEPWFWPTLDAMEDEILEAYSNKIESSILKEWAK